MERDTRLKRVKYLHFQTPIQSPNVLPRVCYDHSLHPTKADGLFDHPSRYPNDLSGIDFHDPLKLNVTKHIQINKCAKPIALAYAPDLNRKNKNKSKGKTRQGKIHTNSLQLFLLLIRISR